MSTYLQNTAAECGLACIAFVAAHHGKSYEMSALRARFNVSMRGMTLADVVRVFRELELGARPLRLELAELPQMAVPCVLHWDMCHFVVLIRCARGKLTIHDPARGERRLTLKEAGPHFTGIALEVFPTQEFARVRPAAAIGWRQLVGKLHGLKRSLVQLFVLAASLQVVVLVAPLFTQWIVDGAIVAGDTDMPWLLALGFGLTVLIRVCLEAARGWLSIAASVQFGNQWAGRIMGHLLRLPAQWFEVRHTGDVVSRLQSMQGIQQAVTGRLVDIMLDGLFGLVTLLVMLLYSAKLAVVVIAALAAYAAIRVLPHGMFHRASDEVLTHEANAQTHFLESLRAIQAIKIAGLEEQRTTRWLNMVIQGANRRTSTQGMTLAFGAGYSLVFGIESISVLAWGASMAISGALTVGMLMAFISYKDEFSSRMQRFIDNLMAVRMLRLHVERLSDIVLSEKEELGPSTNDFGNGDQGPKITLDNVGFRYGSGTPWVLRNVTMEISAGEHVALVGVTGCGKTTLAKIILGLLSPSEGTVRINGVPLAQVGLGNWRRQVAAVMQDDQLLSASLMENIAGFDETIDAQRVQASARLAAVHDEITAMPMGYHSLNGDMGSSLSGGQKQRILLARALYRQPKVLVLDEATSHLDVGREREVNDAIRMLPNTRITIAHRPETIAMAERVIELSPSPIQG